MSEDNLDLHIKMAVKNLDKPLPASEAAAPDEEGKD